jgi:hypothetical protein
VTLCLCGHGRRCSSGRKDHDTRPPSGQSNCSGRIVRFAVCGQPGASPFGDSLGGFALLVDVAATVNSGNTVTMLLLVSDFAPKLLHLFSSGWSDRCGGLTIGIEIAQGGDDATLSVGEPPVPVLLAVRTTSQQNRCQGSIPPITWQPGRMSGFASRMPGRRTRHVNSRPDSRPRIWTVS